MHKVFRFNIFIFLAIVLFGCGGGGDHDPVEWNFDKSEITENKPASTATLNVDVYLDVTGSMEGFSVPGQSNFGRFIDDIEATCQNTWRETDIKYYKYGSRVDSISREEFVSAKNEKTIFTDGTINNKTDFANAIRNTTSQRVSVFITDLFYSNNDINAVVRTIKDKCIEKGIEVGVAGVTSDFNGSVGDLGQGLRRIKVDKQRTLFALVFGDQTNIDLLFRSLRNKPYITGDQFLVFANKPTQSFEVNLEKDRQSKQINKSSLPKKAYEKYGNVFAFTMKERETHGLAHLELILQKDQLTPGYGAANIKAQVFKRTASEKDSVAADGEVKISNVKISGAKLTSDLEITNNDPEGKYSYAVYFTLDNTVPLTMPQWVKDISSASVDSVAYGKTLNLEKLLTDVSTSHVTAMQPKIAKFYIYLEKK
ncbi:hypothetical protein DYBT9275_02831 [Dyadobacter sp. CECT 9275]|uniref:Uncharacterized protein n=1 Tax=Dyadobacter helix TaxID=2822344 RepID=A0A916JEX8_9BACT|nr:hypothetical protein [Dyadobacter sp. CECT 9275]CAG5002186.1 hypothetical protein DYBT9275_02831 [Dyadobacter sp. CECT 9275]